MKKIFLLAFAAFAFVACNNQTNDDTDDMDTTTMETEDAYAPSAAYTPAEGDVTYRDGRVQVYRNNTWTDADNDVTLDNGVVIRRTGVVTRDGTEYVYEEGYVVDSRGNVWDRAGNAVEDAWDATKHGVQQAGRAIGEAARDTKREVKDATD